MPFLQKFLFNWNSVFSQKIDTQYIQHMMIFKSLYIMLNRTLLICNFHYNNISSITQYGKIQIKKIPKHYQMKPSKTTLEKSTFIIYTNQMAIF